MHLVVFRTRVKLDSNTRNALNMTYAVDAIGQIQQ